MFIFITDFTFSSESCGGGAASGGGGGGRGSSLDQDSLGGSVACEEHEVASLTTLHLDSETSSLSHTVTVTGNARNNSSYQAVLAVLHIFVYNKHPYTFINIYTY